MEELKQREEIRVLVLRSEVPKIFCAGMCFFLILLFAYFGPLPCFRAR